MNLWRMPTTTHAQLRFVQAFASRHTRMILAFYWWMGLRAGWLVIHVPQDGCCPKKEFLT